MCDSTVKVRDEDESDGQGTLPAGFLSELQLQEMGLTEAGADPGSTDRQRSSEEAPVVNGESSPPVTGTTLSEVHVVITNSLCGFSISCVFR